MKQKKNKYTYKDMVKILSGFDRQIQTLYTEIHGIKFLLNSYLDMNKDVDKLTEFVEGKIEKEKDEIALKEKVDRREVAKTMME